MTIFDDLNTAMFASDLTTPARYYAPGAALDGTGTACAVVMFLDEFPASIGDLRAAFDGPALIVSGKVVTPALDGVFIATVDGAEMRIDVTGKPRRADIDRLSWECPVAERAWP